MKQKKELLKKLRMTEIDERTTSEGVIQIRGRWSALQTKRRRQISQPDPTTDGSTGVDSEDILGIKNISAGSAQLLPNQLLYIPGASEPGGPGGGNATLLKLRAESAVTGLPGPLTGNQSLLIGLDWIRLQAESAARNNKPVIFTSLGLVTQNNAQAFVPSDSAEPVFANQTDIMYGVTDQQRDEIYQQWIQASLTGGLSGIVQYQWGQGGLSVQPGTPVSTPTDETSSTGSSPNDGYSILGAGASQFIKSIQEESQAFLG